MRDWHSEIPIWKWLIAAKSQIRVHPWWATFWLFGSLLGQVSLANHCLMLLRYEEKNWVSWGALAWNKFGSGLIKTIVYIYDRYDLIILLDVYDVDTSKIPKHSVTHKMKKIFFSSPTVDFVCLAKCRVFQNSDLPPYPGPRWLNLW